MNNDFWVTSEAICQWFSRVTKSWVKIIGKSPQEKIRNFDFVLFWLGIWCKLLVWVIMGRRGVSENAGVLVVIDVTASYPTLGCDIQGFRAMGLSVQYWPRWFQDFRAIWLAAPFGANGAHLGICTLPEKNLLCVWNKLFLGVIKFSQGELVLWSLYGDKLSLCRNQQMNRKI